MGICAIIYKAWSTIKDKILFLPMRYSYSVFAHVCIGVIVCFMYREHIKEIVDEMKWVSKAKLKFQEDQLVNFKWF